MKLNRAVVTGGAGFIGSHLVEYLASKDIDVVVLDNFSTGSISNLNKRYKNLKTVKVDVCDEKRIKPHIKDADAVFHLAAMVGVVIATRHPLEVLENNIGSVKSILKQSLDSNVKKIVFASSSEVYGNKMTEPLREDVELSPFSPYGLSKIVGENYLSAYWEKYGLKSSIVRYFNVYGPRQSTKLLSWVLPSFISRALNNRPLFVYGDGNQTRDFTYVSDAIEGTFAVAERGGSQASPYNICTGVETSINDLAKRVVSVVGNGSEILYKKKRKFEIDRRCGIYAKAQADVGYSPKIGLEEGLRRTISFYN